jgi:hypothetical protein
LQLNDRDILHDAGKISHELAKELAEHEYDEFHKTRRKQEDSLDNDFDYTEASKQGLEGTNGDRPVDIGDVCFIEGVNNYSVKHPRSFGNGENVFCASVKANNSYQKFLGFSPTKFSTPLDEDQIRLSTVINYNIPRTTEEIAFCKGKDFYDLTKHKIPEEVPIRPTSANGFLKGSVTTAHISRIDYLLKNDLSKDLIIKCKLAWRYLAVQSFTSMPSESGLSFYATIANNKLTRTIIEYKDEPIEAIGKDVYAQSRNGKRYINRGNEFYKIIDGFKKEMSQSEIEEFKKAI